jgi:hypothetical protein
MAPEKPEVVASVLDDLWRSRISVILHNLKSRESDHRELANIAQQIEADYHGRFLVELLQNASDQARAAGLSSSTVTVVRTRTLLAFVNQGEPFTEGGLRSVTSIGLSTKDPADSIGNKGVGFKSVFQVTDSPDIFSAATANQSFRTQLGLKFGLSVSPFENSAAQERAAKFITEVLASYQIPDALSVDDALYELRYAAPFKFPIPLSIVDLNRRVEQLGYEIEGQTVVFLPLRQESELVHVVDNAIDELFEGSGAAILFLPAVDTINVIDETRALSRTITRKPAGASSVVNGFGEIATIRTAINDGETREWVVIKRVVGTADVVSADEAAAEATALNEEARSLPGSNWANVTKSPIEVAIPILDSSADQASVSRGANGRICIGLPTKDGTGTPAWVNAHFHGTISRTGIDLKSKPYNSRLFRECVRLHGALIDYLKGHANYQFRQTATLAFQRSQGPLSVALFSLGGQGFGDVILASDGVNFQSAADTFVPDPDDLKLLQLMAPSEILREFGLRLPDIDLLTRARPQIESLAGKPNELKRAILALNRRSDTNQSLLEYAANVNRQAGPEFWNPFLSWVVDRFHLSAITKQRILPVGAASLANSEENVFLPPASMRSDEVLSDADSEITSIPERIAESLRFLDERTLELRKPESRTLTELASKLAPNTGGGLVRRPRLDHLIRDAVGPLMASLRGDDQSRQLGVELLRQVVIWLWGVTDTGKNRIERDAVRVPVIGDNGSWKWVAPNDVYFGPGWLEPRSSRLLNQAYGDKVGRFLLPWHEFSKAFDIAKARDAWIGALETLGVSRAPKILRAPSSRPASLQSDNYIELSIINPSCSFKEAQPYWLQYLESVRHRRVSSKYKFDFRSVTWIDGLERPESRTAVVELMLLHPEQYELHSKTFLERYNRPNEESSTVAAFWVHAISQNDWQVIPTQNGVVACKDAWLVDPRQRGAIARRYALLPQVLGDFALSPAFLKSLGVTALEDGTVSRILSALDRLGKMCPELDDERALNALALSEELFYYLQIAYDVSPESLDGLPSLCLPLARGGAAIGVKGDEITVAYFDDEPARSAFVPGFSGAYCWPLEPRRATKALIAGIREQLGVSALIRTSEAAVETGFIEREGVPRQGLLDWLFSTFRSENVAIEIAALVAFTGRPTDPNGEDFKRTWRMFQHAAIAFGAFPTSASGTSYFYDSAKDLLQVDAGLNRYEIVESTWMLLGPSYRDTLAAYAKQLSEGDTTRFLAERHIESRERAIIESAIGLAAYDRLKHIKSVTLALWRVMFPGKQVEDFESEWEANGRSVPRIVRWLSRSDLEAVLTQSLTLSEEDVAVQWITERIINTNQLQEARLALGSAPLQFSFQVARWNKIRNRIVAALQTNAARLVSTNLNAVERVLRQASVLAPDDSIACSPFDTEIPPVIVSSIEELFVQLGPFDGDQFIRRRLEDIGKKSLAEIEAFDFDDAPRRDVVVYEDDDVGKRTRDAMSQFDGVVSVATNLAIKLGENLSVDSVLADNRVALLRSGWWANRFTLLTAIQRVMESIAPAVAQRMSDHRVFRDPGPANELRSRFEELREEVASLVNAIPRPRITVFGREELEDDMFLDLLKGSGGRIGQVLGGFAAQQTLDQLVIEGARERVIITSSQSKSRQSSRGGSAQKTNKERDIAGHLGEVFLYECFRKLLPSFDETCWVSANRERYGLEGKGNDSLGYDFHYRDIDCLLVKNGDAPICNIEVKSTVSDGDEPFPMSANEWDRARQCHESGDATYVIVRVRRVRDNPQIFDIVVDPFKLYRSGNIGMIVRDFLVQIGQPLHAESRPNMS